MTSQLRKHLEQVDHIRIPDDFEAKLAAARQTPFSTDMAMAPRRSGRVGALVVGFAGLAISVFAIASIWPRGYDPPPSSPAASYSTDTSLSCPGETIGSIPHYSNPPQAKDPIELSRERLAHPTSADRFHIVRDTDAGFAYVFVERDGQAVARFVYDAEPDGRWTFISGLECAAG